jgi:hypothetical protein
MVKVGHLPLATEVQQGSRVGLAQLSINVFIADQPEVVSPDFARWLAVRGVVGSS